MVNERYTEEEAIEFIKKHSGVPISEEQESILRSRRGICIIACAGAGKTTMLILLIAKRVMTGEIANGDVLCTTFSKAGADELNERFSKLCLKLGIHNMISIRTLHSAYLSVIKQWGYKDLGILSGEEKYNYLLSICSDLKIKLGEDDVKNLATLLTYQVDNLLSDENLYNSYVYTLENIALAEYSEIRRRFVKMKNDNRVIDYEDMQLIMYDLLRRNEQVREYCKKFWKEFYIDESQDVSKIQKYILNLMLSRSDDVIFIGDDDQCIYQWRGADPEILLNAPIDYKIPAFYLSTNYRCSSNIVEMAATGIKNNVMRFKKEIKAHNKGGTVYFASMDTNKSYSLLNLMNRVLNRVDELNASGEENSDIAILSRNNKELKLLSAYMLCKNVVCETTSETKFTKSYEHNVIQAILRLAEGKATEKDTAIILINTCPYMQANRAKSLAKVQKDSGLSLVTLLQVFSGKAMNDLNQLDKIPSVVRRDLGSIAAQLTGDTRDGLELIGNIISRKGEIIEKARALFSLAVINMSFRYPSEGDKRYLNAVMEFPTAIMADKVIELRDAGEPEAQLEALALDYFRRKMKLLASFESGDMDLAASKIKISTMHGSKGKEWKHVMLFACDNHVLPSFYGIRKLVKKGVLPVDILNGIREDRRLFYVALTRGKETVTIFGDGRNISVYVIEALGLNEDSDYRDVEVLGFANDDLIQIAKYEKEKRKFAILLRDRHTTESYSEFIRISDTEEERDIKRQNASLIGASYNERQA